MIRINTPAEIEQLREAGRINALAHSAVRESIAPGVTTAYLDAVAQAVIYENGGRPSFPLWTNFPANICVAVNDEIGHGIPSGRRLQEGDVVKVDIGVDFEGYQSDAARTHVVGTASQTAKVLVEATENALSDALWNAQAGKRVSDISFAMATVAKEAGFCTMKSAFGHGISQQLHEEPRIPSFGPANLGPRLRPGMVIAIEPVLVAGTAVTRRLPDGWTDVTESGALSAHVEQTVLITDGLPEVLTTLADGSGNDRREKDSRQLEIIRGREVTFRPLDRNEEETVYRLAKAEMDDILLRAWGRLVDRRELFEAPGAEMTVISLEGQLVGFYSVSRHRNSLHLNTIVIDKKAQGLGIGRAVMRRLERETRGLGLKRLELWVQANNLRAHQFYTRLGFVETGVPYVHTLAMRKYVG